VHHYEKNKIIIYLHQFLPYELVWIVDSALILKGDFLVVYIYYECCDFYEAFELYYIICLQFRLFGMNIGDEARFLMSEIEGYY